MLFRSPASFLSPAEKGDALEKEEDLPVGKELTGAESTDRAAIKPSARGRRLSGRGSPCSLGPAGQDAGRSGLPESRPRSPPVPDRPCLDAAAQPRAMASPPLSGVDLLLPLKGDDRLLPPPHAKRG